MNVNETLFSKEQMEYIYEKIAFNLMQSCLTVGQEGIELWATNNCSVGRGSIVVSYQQVV